MAWEQLPGLGKMQDRNHWHSWIDTIQGREGAFLQSPFTVAAGMAEAGLLCSKAARFPGVELLWDKSRLAFTSHGEASSTIVRRRYRQGFELPAFARPGHGPPRGPGNLGRRDR